MVDVNISDGAVLEALNNKADVDLNNANPGKAFTSQGAGWAMPSDQYIDLTLGSSVEYTCPANGYFCVSKTSTAPNQYLFSKNETTNIKIGEFASNWSGQNMSICLPVRKGDKCIWGGTFGGAIYYLKFVYAQGEI